MEYSEYVTPHVGISIKSAQQVLDEQKLQDEKKREAEDWANNIDKPSYDQLTSHILDTFSIHRDARMESGIEQDMIDDLYQVSGRYQKKELDDVGESAVYMNLTAEKQRDASAWIKDIAMPANSEPFEIVPSESEDIPPSMKKMILDAFIEDEKRLSAEIEEDISKSQQKQTGEGQQVQPQQPQETEQGQRIQAPQQVEEKPKSALIASRQLKEINKLRRDIEEAIMDEIHKVSRHDARKLNRAIIDSFNLGNFHKCFDSFVNDFTTFPTAFMKGPLVTKKMKLTWMEGKAVQESYTAFVDSRINPLDAYPSPGAEDIYDGDFIEHIRWSARDLSDLAQLDESTGYKPDVIKKILLENKTGTPFWLSTNIEEDKAVIEMRGSQTSMNRGVYHGLHFWGSVSVESLKDWGLKDDELIGKEDWEQVEVEAVLIGTDVIKCRINKDPLKRRPYYSACFHPRPGSIWGRSLPNLMRDNQGMCNAAACALADNMGLSAGPQMSILVDRLADDGDIEEQAPLKIWQFNSDPAGNGGKPIEYFTTPSNASDLLRVYEFFATKADDVTGIPKYAHGSAQGSAGAAATAQGLSMLLESASKGIKSAIMNIASGFIKPRVEFQCYLWLLDQNAKEDSFAYSGDINVVVKAIENITIRAAREQLRKELLQVTSNPTDIKIIGMEGRGLMLKEIFRGANFSEDIIPSRLDLKERQAREDANEQKLIDAQSQQGNKSIEATKLQVEGQERMQDKTVQIQAEKLRVEEQDRQQKNQIKLEELRQAEEKSKLDTMFKETDSQRKASTAVGVAVANAQSKGVKNESTE